MGGPKSRSGRGGEEKIPSPRRESSPRTPIVQPVAQQIIIIIIVIIIMNKFIAKYVCCMEVHLSSLMFSN
jgi:hypothetical protein